MQVAPSSLTEVPDDAATTDVDEHALQLNGHGLDYETATSFTVEIAVTDNWSSPVTVPVTVTLKNVNELEFGKTTVMTWTRKSVISGLSWVWRERLT